MSKDESSHVTWRKSSRSNGQDNCVEVAALGKGKVGVRDTKDHGTGPMMVFTSGEWGSFIAGVTSGVLS